MRPQPRREFAPGVNRNRLELILDLESKWVNGTVLHYYFFDRPTDGRRVVRADGNAVFLPWATAVAAEKDVVRRAYRTWSDVGIGLRFEEVAARGDAEIRIAFERGDGFWSYLGRHLLDFGRDDRTMNFDRDLSTYFKGLDTAVHEIGHTLGFPSRTACRDRAGIPIR